MRGTLTLINLMRAYAAESQAWNRYTFYAAVAAREGLKQYEALFMETADRQAEHAKCFFDLTQECLTGRKLALVERSCKCTVPFGSILETLKVVAGEHEDWTEAYPIFAEVTGSQGFPEMATAFKMLALAEESHRQLYAKLS
ncbi:MAG TPA: rubrerythrin family protein [Symbiobacteriaceae bacterium]|nr:rubrerythrin family protein [Symbiobacteriaceae bacterium]